jgi:Clostripain family
MYTLRKSLYVIFLMGLLCHTTFLVTVAFTNNPTTTAIFLIAADNDLYPFAERNIRQMRAVFSKFDSHAKNRLKIALQIDMHRPGQPKISRRFFLNGPQLVQVGGDMCMDSGDPNTLIDCCRWAIESFPADNYKLFLWDHGLGIVEPVIKNIINSSQKFEYNTTTKLVELNRSVGFIDFITANDAQIDKKRSICFDDTTGNYLSNLKLKFALETISKQYLNGKKIALYCDACLMSMIEVVSPLKDCVDFFVGSQEVELGTGYDYSAVFSPFITTALDQRTFACHAVNAYQKTYSRITQDYTQSAMDLSHIHLLDVKIDALAKLLIDGLNKQKNRSVREAIRLSKHKNFCTHFDEPSYIDFGHFCQNLLTNAGRCELKNNSETVQFQKQLTLILQQALNALHTVVIANAAGKNIAQAQGLSIYFPETHIHNSYRQSIFACKTTQWLNFLIKYIGL